MRDTVASLRLDCVLASGLRTSRAKAAEMIREGLVMVEHMPEERVDRLLETGALLSVRGFGRIRLTAVGEKTRKDRLPVTLEIFRRN
jgi:RNA-binding protein YlmH